MHTKVYKIAIVGDGGTGKTSLINAKCNNIFDESTKMTIGIDFGCVPIEDEDDPDNKRSILAFDLGGQKRFHFIHDAYIKGIKAAVILYDLTRFQTFDNINHWHELISKENPNIPIIIVGSKKDLVDDETIKEYIKYWNEVGHEFPNHEQIHEHLFISSKNFDGLDELFSKLEELTQAWA